MAVDIGLTSAYHAWAVVDRASKGDYETRMLDAFRIGPIGFAAATYEMASEHGGEIKEGSPYEYTFILSSNKDYIPREEAIDYKSYEGTNRKYSRETGDLMVTKFVEMLTSMK